MATLMATPQNTLSPPSWDETIVPTLRKRLESESRILSKRLSTISTADEGDLLDSQSTRRRVSPSRKPSTSASITNTQRPSAIPRPSYTRERPAQTPSVARSQVPESASLMSVHQKRKRTQSTPFPFDSDRLSSSTVSNSNDMPLPTTSSSSSRVQSPLGRGTPTPSRIPTVTSRKRSDSHSSQRFGSTINGGGKASLPPSHAFSSSHGRISVDADPLPLRALSIKKSSSNLNHHKEQTIEKPQPQPIPTGSSTKGIDKTIADEWSDEERPYQHWYRGDVSRNGGVGEYRVGKRMEMLDIANFGHTTLKRVASRTRPYEEPGTHTANYAIAPTRKRSDSFSTVDRASMYMDAHDELINGRVIDESPLTDIEVDSADLERVNNGHDSINLSPTEFSPSFGQSSIDTQSPQTVTSHETPTISEFQTQTEIPQAQQQQHVVIPNTFTASITTITSNKTHAAVGSSNTKLNSQTRGRTQSPTNTSDRSAATKTKTKTKTRTQKRPSNNTSVDSSSKTASEPVLSELGDYYTELANAVPETRSPVARDGNWDEVILPTVARRMGIEYDKEDPAKQRKATEPLVPPAPGTFGYDHTKYKPPRRSEEGLPMNEFGQRIPETRVIEEKEEQEIATHHASASSSVELQTGTHRSRRETLPPFSQYSPPPVPDVATGYNYDLPKERQDVPQIIVQPPTGLADTAELRREDVHGAGCCKCVVM